MEDYFGIVEEETIKNNFVLLYELLDGESCAIVHSIQYKQFLRLRPIL